MASTDFHDASEGPVASARRLMAQRRADIDEARYGVRFWILLADAASGLGALDLLVCNLPARDVERRLRAAYNTLVDAESGPR